MNIINKYLILDNSKLIACFIFQPVNPSAMQSTNNGPRSPSKPGASRTAGNVLRQR